MFVCLRSGPVVAEHVGCFSSLQWEPALRLGPGLSWAQRDAIANALDGNCSLKSKLKQLDFQYCKL